MSTPSPFVSFHIDRRYLQAALALARRHSLAPQFARSLEWLLFTALEADADMGPKGGIRHAFIRGGLRVRVEVTLSDIKFSWLPFCKWMRQLQLPRCTLHAHDKIVHERARQLPIKRQPVALSG